MRRRILRIDVTGGRLGGASGTAPIIRHGRSGEVQAALYTGAQPVGGHYCELPDEMFNLSIVHLIGPVPVGREEEERDGRGRIKFANLFSTFRCCAAGIASRMKTFALESKEREEKERERERSKQTLPSNGGYTGKGKGFIPKTKTFNLHLRARDAGL